MERTPESLLHSVFGYQEFRPLQREVIGAVLARQDALAIMPTGGGKSLCYQIPALLFPGLTIVVSPLISLMQDQVAQLTALGVPAVVLNSSLEWEDYRANMGQVRSGKTRLLYVAPETLLTERLQDLLTGVPVDCLTIDEAHCISEWGHDFRPEYRQLTKVRQRFPKAACLALTATATPRVQADIQEALGFKQRRPFIASFNRPNLFLEVQPKQDPEAQTLRFLRRFPDQAGIIYCFSRQQVDELAAFLQQRGIAARPYHAGMSDVDRRANQEAFVRDDIQVIVATIAFGMGINKPNVRFVVHFDLPRNIESYYQEIGRAGRDGLPAHCLLLYRYGDTKKIEYFIDEKEEPERSAAREHLRALVAYADSSVCRRKALLHYFGERFPQANCSACDNCAHSQAEPGSASDLSIPARLLLEAVRQSGERFGAAHLVEILLGRPSEKVVKFGHDRLSVYGKGRDLPEAAWQSLARQLEQQALLERTEHKGLCLTDKGRLALSGKTAVMGQPLPTMGQPPASPKPGPAPGSPIKGIPLLQYDVVLFDLLRKKRKELADSEHVPGYVILPDRSLVEMSTSFPLSLDSLAKIYGFGEVKLQRYGRVFLNIIQDYSRSQALNKAKSRRPLSRDNE